MKNRPPSRRPSPSPQDVLLRQLREEAAMARRYRLPVNDQNTPALAELARAARRFRGRWVRHRGLLFPLRHGFSRHVHDPVTLEHLVSVGFL
jgi:hypothetical protein